MSHLYPLHPPNQFLFHDRVSIINVDSIEEARLFYNPFKRTRFHKQKKNKYIDGALTTKLWSDSADIIIIEKGSCLTLNIQLCNNQMTIMRLFLEDSPDHPHLLNCQNFAKQVIKYPANTFRKNRED